MGWSKFFGGLVHNLESKTIKLTQTLAIDMELEGPLIMTEEGYKHVVKDGNYNNFQNYKKCVDTIYDESAKDFENDFNEKDPTNLKEQIRIE